MKRLRVVAADRGAILGNARLADTPRARAVGLLGRASLDPGDGLILRPCRMIHTFFMRFPIDVLFLDRGGIVVGMARALKPFRLAWGGWRAHTTVELPAGTLAAAAVERGARVRIEEK